jgi:hypothetical protein
MNDQAAFTSHVFHANRVMIRLDPIAARDGTPAVEFALRDALAVYANLIQYQSDDSLTKDEAARLQTVIDRLRARLRFFGESV